MRGAFLERHRQRGIISTPTPMADPAHCPDEPCGMEDQRITYIPEWDQYAIVDTAYARGGLGYDYLGHGRQQTAKQTAGSNANTSVQATARDRLQTKRALRAGRATVRFDTEPGKRFAAT
jgi:hypothetical protein